MDMARCSFETGKFSSPFARTAGKNRDTKRRGSCQRVPISYGEQNSTIARQLEIARSGLALGFSARP